MNLYKQAVRENWTFPSVQGTLSVVQIAQLPLSSVNKSKATLDNVAINLYNEINNAPKVSFVNSSVGDRLPSLKLELVKDLITTIEEENRAKVDQQANASHNAKIDELISTKRDQELASKSVEELLAMKK